MSVCQGYKGVEEATIRGQGELIRQLQKELAAAEAVIRDRDGVIARQREHIADLEAECLVGRRSGAVRMRDAFSMRTTAPSTTDEVGGPPPTASGGGATERGMCKKVFFVPRKAVRE